MTIIQHPTDETLTFFQLGRLDNDFKEYVSVHLKSCSDCASRYQRITSSLPIHAPSLNTNQSQALLNSSSSAVARSTVGTRIDARDLPRALSELTQFSEFRELGRGGMGVVYLARNEMMDRDEVIKILNPSVMNRTMASDRFDREIRAIGKLNHPNIVTAYSAQQIGDAMVCCMEYVSGDDLAKVVKEKGPLSVSKACYYIYQAAQGLQHAFERNMIHRDIKPHNLMLTQEGRKQTIKILDFGLAKSITNTMDQSMLTGAGHVLGTPSYMAPEQIQDASRADIRADIYSLGCTLYYLLTGSPPFVDQSLFAVLQAHKEKLPKPIHEVRSDVPPSLSAVVDRMLAKDPSERFVSPAEVSLALKPFFKPAVTPAKSEPQSLVETASARSANSKTAEKSAPLTVSESPVRPPSKRWLFVFAGFLGALLIALVAGVILVKTRDGTIELSELPDDAVVLVDGETVKLTWAKGEQTAQIQVKPGTRKLEVRKNEMTIAGETVEMESGGMKKVVVKFTPNKANETAAIPKLNGTPPSTAQSVPQWATLFNGTDLTGWKQEDKGSWWSFKDGILKGKVSNRDADNRHFLVSEKVYSNFTVRFECQISDSTDAGLALRTVDGEMLPLENSPKNKWAAAHPTLKLVDQNKWSQVAVVGQLNWIANGASLKPKSSPKCSLDEWHRMEVTLNGDQCKVTLNDNVIQDAKLDTNQASHKGISPALKRNSGRIGFQITGGTLQIRNAEIQSLTSEMDNEKSKQEVEFTPLFNGKDLTGWISNRNTENPLSVSFSSGIAVLTRKDTGKKSDPGRITSVNFNMEDFHLRGHFKIKGRSSFIQFRRQLNEIENDPTCYGVPLGGTAALSNFAGPENETGSLLLGIFQNEAKMLSEPQQKNWKSGDWNFVEVIAIKNQFQIKFNDQIVNQFVDEKSYLSSGQIGILCRAGAEVSIKNLEWKPLRQP